MNEKERLIHGALGRDAFAALTREERMKYEIAQELGLLERVREVGWAGLTAKETGRIGGMIGRRKRL
ncbi:MAG: small, acid-soluble spore protein, alpha/beta type [Clostridia bacterium]|nr:small, acid-soluble spore protein, alpha/beta type [Clostridia bacterium]